MKRLTIHGPLRDTLAFVAHLRLRNKRFRSAKASNLPEGAMNRLARELHPGVLALRIALIREETPVVRTYRLVPAQDGKLLPPFRAGQYLSLEDRVNAHAISRPYSISCSPDESSEGNYYEITVKRKADGFFSPHIMDSWKPGSLVRSSGPQGAFYYEALRDGEELVCLAGGTGITPFRAFIPDALAHTRARLTLFFGAACPDELLFLQDFEALARGYPDRFKLVAVCADAEPGWVGERGFLSAELIRKNLPALEKSCYFLCGPEGLKRYFDEETRHWGLRPRQVRTENYGVGGVSQAPGGAGATGLSITVDCEGTRTILTADPDETIMEALERAGLEPPSLCRSGACGWCRSRLVTGEVFVKPGVNGLRKADGKFGYFHPCISYPRSSIVMKVPGKPVD